MNLVREFVKKMLWVEFFGIVGLLIAGWILTLAQEDIYCWQQGNFFTYRIRHLDRTPAWFVCAMVQFAVNGFWMFKLSALEGSVHAPRGGWGYWNASVPLNPLKVFAINLILIPGELFGFILIRNVGW